MDIMAIKEKIRNVIGRLPFNGLAAKVPALAKVSGFANYAFCVLVLGAAVCAFAQGGGLSEKDFKIMRESENYVSISYIGKPRSKIVFPASIKGKKVIEITNIESEDLPSVYKKLTSVVIPEGVLRLDLIAFDRCENLESVSLPESLRIIGNVAFGRCKKLTSIRLPNGLLAIHYGAFEESGLSSISLPGSLVFVDEKAFWKCENLEKIDIPEKMKAVWCEGRPWPGDDKREWLEDKGIKYDIQKVDQDVLKAGGTVVTNAGSKTWVLYKYCEQQGIDFREFLKEFIGPELIELHKLDKDDYSSLDDFAVGGD